MKNYLNKITFSLMFVLLFFTAISLLFFTNNGEIDNQIESVYADSAFAGGDGTRKNPYLISTEGQLALLRQEPYLNSEFEFKLINNIVLSSNWTPIGKYGSLFIEHKPFSGVLNGDGYKISGVRGSNGGLFDCLKNATIQNLNIEIHGNGIGNSGNTFRAYGGLTNYSLGNVEINNCSVTGGKVIGGKYSGGLIGLVDLLLSLDHADIAIRQSYSTVAVESNGDAGGLLGQICIAPLASAGYRINMDISKCYATGNIKGKESVGGFIGRIGLAALSFGGEELNTYNLVIRNCYAKGNVAATSTEAVLGTFIGRTGNLYGEIEAGGTIIAENKLILEIKKCYASGFFDNGKATFIGEKFLDFSLTSLFEKDIENEIEVEILTASVSVDSNSFYYRPSGSLSTQTIIKATSTSSIIIRSDDVALSWLAELLNEGKGKSLAEMKNSTTYTGWSSSEWQIVNGYLPALKGFSQEVVLDKGEGSGGTDSVNFITGWALPSGLVAPQPTNQFGGYYTQPNGQGLKVYDENMNSLIPAWFLNPTSTPVTLYAYYPYAPTDIYYNDGFGVHTKVSEKWEAGKTYNITRTETKPGYIFQGWYNEDFSQKITSITANKNIEEIQLYALWKVESSINNIQPFYLSEGATIEITTQTNHDFGENLEVLFKLFNNNGTEIKSENFTFNKNGNIYSYTLTNKQIQSFGGVGNYTFEISSEKETFYISETANLTIKTNKPEIEEIKIINGITPGTELTCHSSDIIVVELDKNYGEFGKMAFYVILSNGSNILLYESETLDNTFFINMSEIYGNSDLFQYLSLDEVNTFKFQFISLNDNIFNSNAEFSNIMVNRKAIEKPKQSTRIYTYNESQQTQPYSSNNYYVISEEDSDMRALNVGTYSVVFKLLEGYCWENGETNDVILTWEINPRKLTFPKLTKTSFIYNDGRRITPSIQNNYLGAINATGDVSAVNVGNYQMIMSLKSSNYTWEDGTTDDYTLYWEIVKKKIEKPVDRQYEFKDQVISWYYPDYLSVKEGTTSAKFVGQYFAVFEIRDKENYIWSDNTMEDHRVDWEIVPIPVSISSVEIRNNSEKWNTKINYENDVLIRVTLRTAQTSEKVSLNQAGNYGVVKIDIDGVGSFYGDIVTNTTGSVAEIIIRANQYGNVGLKEFTITLIENSNYYEDETFAETFQFQIQKKKISWGGLNRAEFHYDGTVKNVVPQNGNLNYFKEFEGNSATEVGTYNYSFEFNDPINYSWTDDTIVKTGEWKILGAYNLDITTNELTYGDTRISGTISRNTYYALEGILSLYFNNELIVDKQINLYNWNNSYSIDMPANFFNDNDNIVINGENNFTIRYTYINGDGKEIVLEKAKTIVINRHITSFEEISINNQNYLSNDNLNIDDAEYNMNFEIKVSGLQTGQIELWINGTLIKIANVFSGKAYIELELDEYKDYIVFGQEGTLKLKFIPDSGAGYTEIEKTLNLTVYPQESTIIIQAKSVVFMYSAQTISATINEDIEGVVKFYLVRKDYPGNDLEELVYEATVSNKIANFEMDLSQLSLTYYHMLYPGTFKIKAVFTPDDPLYTESEISKDITVEDFDKLSVTKLKEGSVKYGALSELFRVYPGSFRGVIKLEYSKETSNYEYSEYLTIAEYNVDASFYVTIALTEEMYNYIRPGKGRFKLTFESDFLDPSGEVYKCTTNDPRIGVGEINIEFIAKKYNIYYHVNWLEVTDYLEEIYQTYYENESAQLPDINEIYDLITYVEEGSDKTFIEQMRTRILLFFTLAYSNYDDELITIYLDEFIQMMLGEAEEIEIPNDVDKKYLIKAILFQMFLSEGSEVPNQQEDRELFNQISQTIIEEKGWFDLEPDFSDSRMFYLMEEIAKRMETIKGDNYIYKFASMFGLLIKEVNNFGLLLEMFEAGFPFPKNFEFEGWYLGTAEGCDFTTPITFVSGEENRDLHIYLKINKLGNNYNINYDLNGGVIDPRNPTEYSGEEEIVIYSPTKRHHRFIGWTYEGQNMPVLNPVIPVGSYGDFNFVAHWEKIIYVVYVNEKGEIEQNVEGRNPDIIYLQEGNHFENYLLKQPIEKTGYIFAGWYTSAEFINQITEISDEILEYLFIITDELVLFDPTDEFLAYYIEHYLEMGIKFYAKWEPIKYYVEYDSNGGVGEMENSEHFYGIEKNLNFNAFNKPFHRFIGWTLNSNGTGDLYEDASFIINLAEIEGQTITLYAQWEEIEYSISYELNGGENNPANPSTYTANNGIISIQNPTKTGYQFFGWTFPGQNFPIKDLEISGEELGAIGNVTFVANWVEYVVIYHNVQGVVNKNSTARLYNQNFVLQALPNQTGYKFGGWYLGTDESCDYQTPITIIEANTNSENEIHLYANWIPEEYTIHYFIDWFRLFNDNYYYKSGYSINPSLDLTNSYVQEELFRSMQKAKRDITILYYLTYFEKEYYDSPEMKEILERLLGDDLQENETIEDFMLRMMEFDSEEEAIEMLGPYWLREFLYIVATELIPKDIMGHELAMLMSSDLVVLNGIVFEGWYLGTVEGCDFTIPFTGIENGSERQGDLYIYAKFSTISPEDNRIYYELNGGLNNQENPFYYSSDYENFTLKNPSKIGYNFVGWTYEGQNTPIKNPVINPVEGITYTFTAHWGFEIIYELNGGTNNPENPNYYFGNSDNFVIQDPTREGYEFLGWLYETQIDPIKEPTIIVSEAKNYEFIAVWRIAEYSITYELNGGQNSVGNVNSYNIESGDVLIKNPTRMGYEFLGWTYEGQNEPIKNPVILSGSTENYTFAAHWNYVEYQIRYELDGGVNNPENPATYNIESNSIIIARPTKAGYTFLGWTTYSGSAKVLDFEISQGSIGDYTLTAHWAYQISYELDGGVNNPENPDGYTGEVDVVIKNPTKTGYEFLGWTYEGQNEPIKDLTLSAGLNQTLVLVAHWRATEYTISYELNGGTYEGDFVLKHLINDEIILPTNIFRNGFVFDGWYLNANFQGDSITIISIGSYGDKTLYAKWILVEPEVSLNLQKNYNNTILEVIFENSNPDIQYTYKWQKFDGNNWIDLDNTSKLVLDKIPTGEYKCIVKAVYEDQTQEVTLTYEFEEKEESSVLLIIIISAASSVVVGIGVFFLLRKVIKARRFHKLATKNKIKNIIED